jgi:PAS domain S-box-containing protein
MKIDKNSLRFKLSIPIIILGSCLFLFVYLLSNKLLNNVVKEYHQFYISKHSFEIKKIFEKAITELTTAQLINTEAVVEAKKLDVIEEIKLYWSNNNFQGIIRDSNKTIESTVKDIPEKFLLSLANSSSSFINFKGRHYHIFSINFPSWDLQIITLGGVKDTFSSEKQIRQLLFLILSVFVLSILIIFYVIHKNLNPIKNIVKDLNEFKEIRKTSITELDVIGNAINESFKKLFNKTLQCQTLHSIATSLQEYSSIDELMEVIVEKSMVALNSKHGAIVTYDEKGNFKKFIPKGDGLNTNTTPKGKGILELIRLSLTPVRINNLLEHPAFSGSFPEGHPIIKNFLGYPIFSSEGKPIAAMYFGNKEGGYSEEDEMLLKAISADVTMAFQRANYILELRKFQEVIDSAFDIAIIVNQDKVITYVNLAFEKITGYSKKEVIGQEISILESDYHDRQFYQDIWNTLRAGLPWKGEFINRHKNGEIYHTSAVIFPIRFENETFFVSIQRDITQEKKLYEHLLRAQKMEAIGTLAGGIAHDFNNLLTAVLGYSEIMLGMIKEGDPFYKPVNIIYNAAEKGADLARKILTITRKEKMEMKLIDINEIIHNCLELLQRSIPKNIEIVTNLKKDLPKFMADPSQIQQVIMNLTVNASDAMPNGGKLIIESSLVGSENGAANGLSSDNSGFIKLSVSDTGIGIDKETQRKIFDPFFTTKETGKGTGLGLYIVHSIVNNHRGYINLYSEKGKGTRFNIYFPIIKGLDKENVDQEIDLSGTGTILVIDDEENMRELCKDILEPLGYTVILCPDGEEGIKTFRKMKDNISLVLLDMIMPKISGSEIFQTLRSIKPDTKIILCSGYSNEGFGGIDRLLKSGAKGFIQKPFTAKTIATTIKNVLREEENKL